MTEILHVDFSLGIRKDIFKLSILPHIPLEVRGIPWSNTYSLKLDNSFFSFWEYIKRDMEVKGK